MSLGEKIRRNVQTIYRGDESVSGYTQAQMQTSTNPINETSDSEAAEDIVEMSQGDEHRAMESERKSISAWLRVAHAVIIVFVIAASITAGVLLSRESKSNNANPTELEPGNTKPSSSFISSSMSPTTVHTSSSMPSTWPTSSNKPSSSNIPSALYPLSNTPSSYPTIYVQKVTDGLLLTIKMTCFPDEDVPQSDIDVLSESIVAASVDGALVQGIYNVEATVIGALCTVGARNLLWDNVVELLGRRLPTSFSVLDFSVVITGDYRPPKRAGKS